MTPHEVITLVFTVALLSIAGVTIYEKRVGPIEMPAFVKPSVFEPAIERRVFADI